MGKDEIFAITKSFLSEGYSEEYLIEFTKKGPKKFFNGLSKFDERQVKKVLNLHPEFANATYDGWHALHYAACTNDSYIVDAFMKGAITQGLSSLPLTEQKKRGMPANVQMTYFCAAMNCEKSLAKILTYITNVDETDFGSIFRYALAYNSPKSIPLLAQILGKEETQKNAFKFCMWEEGSNDVIYRSNMLFMLKSVKYDMSRFEDYGIDIAYKEENEKNYFTATLRILSQNLLDYDSSSGDQILVKDLTTEKLIKLFDFFMSKGFDLDTPDGKGSPARKYLDTLVTTLNNTFYESGLEKYLPLLEKRSLENQLQRKNVPAQKRIKI